MVVVLLFALQHATNDQKLVVKKSRLIWAKFKKSVPRNCAEFKEETRNRNRKWKGLGRENAGTHCCSPEE